MARIRTIKPDFFDDDELAQLPALTRLAFIGLWTQADKAGRLEDRPVRVKARLFPYEPKVDMDSILSDLERGKYIIRYQIENKAYIQIRTWSKHQRPHMKELESVIPEPFMTDSCAMDNRVSGSSPGSAGTDPGISGPNPLGREGKGREREGVDCSEPQAASEPESPPVCEFPVVGGKCKVWILTEAKLSEWVEAFPGLDVNSEIKSALQWCRDNPSKRKTAKGMPAFLGSWLRNNNDKGRGARDSATSSLPADVAARVERLAVVFADVHERKRGTRYVARPGRDVEPLVALCRGYSDDELAALVDGYMRAKGADYDDQPRSPGRLLDKASVIEGRLKELAMWPKPEAA